MKTRKLIITVITLIASVWTGIGNLQAADSSPSPDGTWTWTDPGRNGGPERKFTLKLKSEAGKLKGTVSSPGRDGQVTDTAIEDAKLQGDDLNFKVIREVNGNKIAANYSGKLSGDALKGKVETDRNGEKQTRDWEAKRETSK